MPQMVDELPIARSARLRVVAEAIDEGRRNAEEAANKQRQS
jgi:hypothetical protein